jgi:hypothetical protein
MFNVQKALILASIVGSLLAASAASSQAQTPYGGGSHRQASGAGWGGQPYGGGPGGGWGAQAYGGGSRGDWRRPIDGGGYDHRGRRPVYGYGWGQLPMVLPYAPQLQYPSPYGGEGDD